LIILLADWAASATLVAVMMTLCPALIVAGAVYRPVLESAPTSGLSDQVTLVLLVPVTVAVNGWVCEAVRFTEAGPIVTTGGGIKLTLALADWVASATLVAVMMTLCPALIVAGAVYRPVLESAPTAGLSDQVTLVLLVPVTVAVNCWLCEAVRFTEVGPMVTTGGGGGPRV